MGGRGVGERGWRGWEIEGVDSTSVDVGDECYWATLMDVGFVRVLRLGRRWRWGEK